MIKLKDILFESTTPDIFIPRRMEDRLERLIKGYIRRGSKGDLNLSELGLTELPEILNDISVDGDFMCGYNKLTSLKNSPKHVNGSFYCYGNKLTSLKGAPKTVGYNFYCYGNKLTSLKGAPKTVGYNFNCHSNNLTSLEGAPEYVGGNFYCNGNKLESLEGAPKIVDGDFNCINNPYIFSKRLVRAVSKVKGKIIV